MNEKLIRKQSCKTVNILKHISQTSLATEEGNKSLGKNKAIQ